MNIPLTIDIKSDQNRLEFVSEDKKKGTYKYQYTVSISKKGEYLELDETHLTKLIKNNQ